MTTSYFKKFLSYYRPYLGLFVSLMLGAVVVAGISLAFPLVIRHLVQTAVGENLAGSQAPIYRAGLLMLGLVAAHTAGAFYVDYRGHAMGAMMESDVRAELFNHLQKLPFRFYDEEKTGQLMSRITHDLLMLAELYHHGPEDLVVYLVRFSGAVVILLAIDSSLALAVFLFLPPLAVFAYIFTRRLHGALKRSKERIADVNAQVEDNLSGIRVVKSFANEASEMVKFAAHNRRFLESRKTIYLNEAIFYDGVMTFVQLMTVAVVVYGGVRISGASLDLPDLLVFLLYIGYLTEPLLKFSHIAAQYQDGFTGFERFMQIMDTAPEPPDTPGARDLDQVRGSVAFRGVGFRYHERHTAVLKNISLEVEAGEYVAVVGSSGVGKTTLCSLIPRFYEVTEGQVLLDGVDVRDIRLQSLRRSVGVVQQDVYLFAGTVLENIRYGKPGAAFAEVEAAAKKANAHGFITALPHGYDTDIGQRGVKLSGGQKQRLSIARVFLKDPAVLIFDEATSSLDNESERVIQEALEELAKDRTTFVIAHRLSTIRNARRILVLTDRGIEEQGTHEALLAQDGVYARLYHTQSVLPEA